MKLVFYKLVSTFKLIIGDFMEHLKYSSLILSNRIIYEHYFIDYFKNIHIAVDNSDALKIYNERHSSVLFLDCNDKKTNTLDIIKEIRKTDQDVIIAVFTEKLEKQQLLKALPLKLIGCLVEPLDINVIEALLNEINAELLLRANKKIYFSHGYSFEFDTKDIYDNQYNKVHLSKNETLLMEFLLKNKNYWVENDLLGYYIWGDSFYEKDCNGRMKTLLYSIRKKLPKDTIRNSYGLGYMVETIT